MAKEHSASVGISRRQAIQAGLTTAAALAFGASADAAGQDSTALASNPRVIDIHAHYFPHSYLDIVATDGKKFDAAYYTTDRGWFIKTPAGGNGPLPAKFIDLEARIADMDAQGVGLQVISLTAPMLYWGDAELSEKLAVAWNDAAAEACRAYPTRLMAFLTLPMLYPDRSLRELERASKLPGMRGVYLGTNIAQRDLDDPLFESVLAEIEKRGLPIFLHPIDTQAARLNSYFLFNLVGNPVDTAIAACHLIFGGVLDRHPNLKICLPHGGGVLPILTGRIDQGWKVRSDLKHLPQAPSDYLKRFTYDTITHSKSVMEFVIREVGAERVMIGSDYCFTMGYNQPVRFLDQLDLKTSERRMILGGNAERILKLQSSS